MQFPESWLRTMANPSIDTDALAHQLTMAGLEVEEVEPVAPPFTGVVVARIESVEPHPNADKLRVCRVDAGQGELLQIVCGAPNAAVGLVVPLAGVGAVLPGDFKIGVAKMRGVESAGMLCSAKELGLSQENAGLLSLDPSLMPGMSLRQALDLDESVLTLKLTPNRADCLSILGVAREVAALNGCALINEAVLPTPVTIEDRIKVEVLATDLCGRFAGRVVRGVNARAETPAWMVQRLERAGQRSVSALVDISNYLMLERGRPTHVFDLDKMVTPSLTVRWAKAGETLKLLNGETIELTDQLGVIASGDRVESLAGIMGGDETAVSLQTQNVYLEAAFWWPQAIAGRTRTLKIPSEAAHRFERGVDFVTIAEDLERLTQMVLVICGGQAGPIDDQTLALPERAPVDMRLSRCQKILGIACTKEQVAQVFDRLGFVWEAQGDVFKVTPPSFRFDLSIEEDLIEEVARMIGFDNIPARPPMARAKMLARLESKRDAHAIRATIAARDYQEVVNFSFVERAWETERLGQSDPIALVNPIASQMSVMRSSLLPGLIANTVYNANRRQTRVRVFELGRVFTRAAEVKEGALSVAGVAQPLKLAALAWGPCEPDQWASKARHVDFFDLKNDVEVLLDASRIKCRFVPAQHPLMHPGRCAEIWVDVSGEGLSLKGLIGELHPQWVREDGLSSAPVLFELDLDCLVDRPLPAPEPLSKQPMVQRDMALWVSANTPYQSLLDTIWATIASDPSMQVVRDVTLFDVWQDQNAQTQQAGEVSMALRFWLQDQTVTLEDDRVEQCLQTIRHALEKAHNARQR
jgi:phenylalanyl-tRNA synthetase beta chain